MRYGVLEWRPLNRRNWSQIKLNLRIIAVKGAR